MNPAPSVLVKGHARQMEVNLLHVSLFQAENLHLFSLQDSLESTKGNLTNSQKWNTKAERVYLKLQKYCLVHVGERKPGLLCR